MNVIGLIGVLKLQWQKQSRYDVAKDFKSSFFCKLVVVLLYGAL